MSTSNIIKHIIDNDIEIDIKNYDNDENNDNHINRATNQNNIDSLHYTPIYNKNDNAIINESHHNICTIAVYDNVDTIAVYDKEDLNKVISYSYHYHCYFKYEFIV